MIIEVTEDNFQAEVIESDKAVLVDFWAPWCAPCRAMVPVFESIDDPEIKVAKINVDENPKASSDHGVISIPTTILFRNGSEVSRVVGAHPKNRLLKDLGL